MDKAEGQYFPGQTLPQRGIDVLVTGHLAAHSTALSVGSKYSREERTLPLTRSGEWGREKDTRATHGVLSCMLSGLRCAIPTSDPHQNREEGVNMSVHGMRCWNLGWWLHLGRRKEGSSEWG